MYTKFYPILHKPFSFISSFQESENSNWKGQQKNELLSVHDLVNLLNNDDATSDDAYGGGHYHRDAWVKTRPGQHR